VDDTLRIETRIVRQTRRSAIIDFDLYLNLQLVTKATVTLKIN
jgi:CBS domain protein